MSELSPSMQAIILHWGEMGSRWGLNRSAAQILILLHLSPAPLCASDISETLGIARSNVSAGLKELGAWQVIEGSRRLGDRKEYFTAPRDLATLARAIHAARHEREVAPYRATLTAQIGAAATDGTPPEVLDRLQATAEVMDLIDEALRSALEETLATLSGADPASDQGGKPRKKKKKAG